MIKELLKAHLWILPFVFFFSTFFLSFIFFSQEKRAVPSLLYLTPSQALTLLAHQQLNCRLLKEQESSWPPGTIIAQSPQPGKYVKPFQTIFITLAKPTASLPVPSVLGLSRAQVKNIFNSSYQVRWYPVYSPDIQHRCIAQINNDQEIFLYESHNEYKDVIMPSFSRRTVEECRDFLHKYGIEPTIVHTGSNFSKHTCNTCIVTEQNPSAGTIISLTNPPLIQLKV